MPDRYDATGVGDILAAIGGAGDVRAALDAGGIAPDARVLPALKREIDRLVLADLAEAARVADAAAWVADRLGDDVSRAFADATRARLLHARSQYKEAEPLYAEAAETLRAARRAVDAAALAKQRMEALQMLGRFPEAFELAREARRVLRSRGERRLLAEHETNTGNLFYYLDRFGPALGHYERAYAILREAGDAAHLAVLDYNRATIQYELGRLDEAQRLYERAATTVGAHGRTTLASHAEMAAAYIEFLRGHFHEALRRMLSARESGRLAPDSEVSAFTDLDLAEVYLRLNAYPEAEASALRAVEFFAANGMRRQLGTANRFAALASAGRGRTDDARALLASAVSVFEELDQPVQAAIARLDLAQLAAEAGLWDAASREASSAATAFSRAGSAPRRRLARALDARAALETGDLARASRVARAVLRAADTGGWIEYLCQSLLAEVDARRGRRASALERYQKAIGAVERLRASIVVDQFKSTFLEDKISLYEGAVRLCLDAGSPEHVERAFTTLELAKSRSLADLLTEYLRECVPGDARGREAREAFRRLVDELAWRRAVRERREGEGPPTDGVRRQNRRLDRDIEAFERRVSDAFRRLQLEDARFAELHSPSVVEPRDLGRIVGERETLVEYVVTGDAISAIVATERGLVAVRDFATASRVDALLDGLRFQIEKFTFGRAYAEREIAHLRRGCDLYLGHLYDALVRPLEPLLGTRDVVVIPHGRLHYVPFHALWDGCEYVVERRGVSYAPSATVYALCVDMPTATGVGALVCGVSDASAPEIDRELDALERLFPSATVLSGRDATRRAVTRSAEGRSIVHIASHARFRADNPMLSSIQLADGDLTFYDVLTLRLSADLVVLSGCNTGMVAVGAGDELHGLMRGFLYAGAPSMVISMWAADDAATAGLMQDFYEALQSGETKREALRRAQRKAVRRWHHPYYWAPFMLFGRAV